MSETKRRSTLYERIGDLPQDPLSLLHVNLAIDVNTYSGCVPRLLDFQSFSSVQ